jgi:PAS domain S-box-containing protein
VLQLALAAAATVACAHAAQRGGGAARLFWIMVAGATGLWAAGQLLFTLEHTALSPAASSDLQRATFLLAAAPLAMAALVRPDRAGVNRALVVLDVALVAGLVLFLYLYVGVRYRPEHAAFAMWRQAASGAQLLGILLTLVPLASVSSPAWSPTYRAVAAAGVLWFAGNAVLAALFLVGGYRAGVLDVPWTVPFVWLAAAASVWRDSPAAEPAAPSEPWRDTRRGVAIALGAVGIVPMVHLVTTLAVTVPAATWHARTGLTLAAMVPLGVLFAIRQLLVVRAAEASARAHTLEIAQVNARFQRAFRHSPAAMTLVQAADARVVDANTRCADLLDLPRSEIVGARLTDLLIPGAEATPEVLADLVQSGRPTRSVAVRFHTRAGAPVDALVSVEPIALDSGQGALLLIEDVRERRGLEERLVSAQKMDAIGRLAGGIAHEFNNLLTAIMNAGSLAIEEIDRPAVVAGHLDRIDRASDRAANLTRQLLAFGRRQALKTEAVDLAAVLDEMRAVLPPMLGEDVRLDIQLGRHVPRVRADRAQLKQVILNLAANARDAMPRGGHLTIALDEVPAEASSAGVVPRAGATEVQLSVRDDGMGMNEQVQQHLFEPFFTTKDPLERGGLGLAAVYGIVTQSGGRISVESEPGRGTTVRVVLPVEGARAVPAGASS